MKLIFSEKRLPILYATTIPMLRGRGGGYIRITPRYIYLSKEVTGKYKTLKTAKLGKDQLKNIYDRSPGDSLQLGAEPICVLKGEKIEATFYEHQN